MAKSQKRVKRNRKFNRISYKERVTIENRYCTDKQTIKDIAKELNRHITTITREIVQKPRIGRGRYNSDIAQTRAINTSKH